MSVELLREIERAHAIAAWLATIALVITAASALLGRRSAGSRRGLAATASALVLLTGALGFLLDEGFRSRLRQRLFLASPSLGWLFERKQHLAFGAMALAVAGLLAALASRDRGADGGGSALAEARARSLRRAEKAALVAAAALALVASIAGALVARRVMF